MKEKILIISKFSNMGGTRTFYNNFIEYMLTKDYDIHLLFINNVLGKSQIELLEKNNITYKILKTRKKSAHNPGALTNIYTAIYCYYFAYRYKINKITFTHWGLNSDFLTLPIFLLRKQIILFVHSEPYTPNRFKFIWKLLTKFFSKLISNHKLITVSNYNKMMIEKNWLDKSTDVKVIYNFSNIELKRSEEKDRHITILTLGHVRDYKNPELWLEVARKITSKNRTVKFVWAGEGELLKDFQDKTKKNKNINFIGYKKDVTNLYKSSDIYLQLSKIETQGIAVIDAMKYRIPCIVSNKGGLPESVKDNHTGFVVDLKDTDSIIKKINLLIKDKNKRKKMGSNGFDLYTRKFSKEEWHKKLDEYF